MGSWVGWLFPVLSAGALSFLGQANTGDGAWSDPGHEQGNC